MDHTSGTTERARTVQDVVAVTPRRLSLVSSHVSKLPFVTLGKIAATAFAILLFFGSAQAPVSFGLLAAAQNTDDETATEPADDGTLAKTQVDVQRLELEAQLAELEKEMAEQQKTIESYQKQGKTLSGEVSTLNAKISKLNLQIKAVSLNLSQLSSDINTTQRRINQTENRIEANKSTIAQTVRRLYEADQESLFAIMITNTRLSDFFGNLENLTLVQANLRNTLAEITKLRSELLGQKEELSLQKEDTENLRAIQEAQKRTVQSTQTQKSTLLKETKGKESEYKKILAKTQATAAQIRSRIFELLGGGELTFEKAYDYAKLAEGATGVRAALILSILHRESLLGKNVGRCSYVNAMHPTRDVPYFLDLLKRLNVDPTSTFAQVSCANQHGAYGGAMGPAQFIPSTWKLYESRVTAVTGNNPPSPWNNADAFAATAVFMRDLLDSSSCKEYANANKNTVPYQNLLERCAAAKYYSGGNWYTYRLWYGEPVVVKANEFQQDIDVLLGTKSS